MNLPLFEPLHKAKNNDPQTSHEAAANASKFVQGHYRKILDYLDGIHPHGATYKQIARAIPEFTDDPAAVARRTGELRDAGLLEAAGTVKPEGSRNRFTLWRAKA